MGLIKKIFLPLLLFFIFPQANAATTTPDTFVDTSFGTDSSGTVTPPISSAVHSWIQDILVTDDYIVVTGTNYNNASVPFCATVLLDKQGNVLDTERKYDSTGAYHYDCRDLTQGADGKIYGVGTIYAPTDSSGPYGVYIFSYNIVDNALVISSEITDFSSNDIHIYSSIVLGDYLFLAGSFDDDFYLDRRDLTSLSTSTTYSYDVYSSSGGDTVEKLLKSEDETQLYLVGGADDHSTYAVIKLSVSGSSLTKDTSYGNYNDIFIRNYTSFMGYVDLGGEIYLEDAYLDGENVITTGRVTATDGTHKIFMERVRSTGGNGTEASTYITVGNTHEIGNAIVASGDYVYVGGILDDGSGIFNFAAWRFTADELDTTFGTDGVLTTDFNSGNDYVYAMAIDDDKLYLAGSIQGTDTFQDFGIARYNLVSTEEEEEEEVVESGEETEEETCTATASTESLCYDGTDDECDGLVDCDDDECTTSVFCTGITAETNCTDGLDDEGDGSMDCEDTDCVFDAACVLPSSETNCTDDVDEDGDGVTDCNDSDCDADVACVDDIIVDPSPEIIAAVGSGCGCNFTATSPRGFRSLGYLVVMVVAVVALMARKRRQKK